MGLFTHGMLQNVATALRDKASPHRISTPRLTEHLLLARDAAVLTGAVVNLL